MLSIEEEKALYRDLVKTHDSYIGAWQALLSLPGIREINYANFTKRCHAYNIPKPKTSKKRHNDHEGEGKPKPLPKWKQTSPMPMSEFLIWLRGAEVGAQMRLVSTKLSVLRENHPNFYKGIKQLADAGIITVTTMSWVTKKENL